MELIFTLLVAVAGGLLAKRFKVPAGAMIGAMAAVAALNIATGQAFLPTEVKVVVQIIAGLFIGVGIRKQDVLALRRVLVPAVLAVAAVILLTLGMGFLLWRLTPYDLVTSLFSCAPGGLVDMTLISYDMGADTSVVSVLQLVRLMSVMALFPPAISWIVRRHAKRRPEQAENGLAAGVGQVPEPVVIEACLAGASAGQCAGEAEALPVLVESAVEADMDSDVSLPPAQEQGGEKPPKKRGAKELAITLLVGGASGFLGYLLGIPAGTIVFAMVGVAVQNILFDNAYMPNPVKTGAQVCSGALIGEGITFAAVLSLQSAILPALAFLVGYLLISMAMSLVLFKCTDLDIGTAFFCCAPGGLSDLTLIAGDLGADVAKVTIFQLLRSVTVIALYPVIIAGLTAAFPGL